MFKNVIEVVNKSNKIMGTKYKAKDFYDAVGYRQTTISHRKINIPESYQQTLTIGFLKLCKITDEELFNAIYKEHTSILKNRIVKHLNKDKLD